MEPGPSGTNPTVRFRVDVVDSENGVPIIDYKICIDDCSSAFWFLKPTQLRRSDQYFEIDPDTDITFNILARNFIGSSEPATVTFTYSTYAASRPPL